MGLHARDGALQGVSLGEDGLLGWTDRECRLCYSTSLWNGNDSILKERLFGLGNTEGNHGEDVKEQYYYLDATPTHSYAKALYKYPQQAFPYDDLLQVNHERGYDEPEYELLDTVIFEDERYFDVKVEYAKSAPEDTLIRLIISNRGPEPATLTVAPTLTLRNNWSWRTMEEGERSRPGLWLEEAGVMTSHRTLGHFLFVPVDDTNGFKPDEVIFTENDTNFHRLDPNNQGETRFSKDAFDRYLVRGGNGRCQFGACRDEVRLCLSVACGPCGDGHRAATTGARRAGAPASNGYSCLRCMLSSAQAGGGCILRRAYTGRAE